jgi:hypothetical protein
MSMIFDDVRDDGEALRIAVAALRLSISHSTGTESSLYSYRDRICTKHVAAGLARRADELAPSVAEADEEHVRNLRKALEAASAQAEQAVGFQKSACGRDLRRSA